MPPKAATSKKTEQKKKDKVADDRTFGLKNKKGNKQQKFVQQVQAQVKGTSVRAQEEAKATKKGPIDELADLNKLLKPVPGAQAISKDVDPKSILCLFFKQGICQKGNKCKFSHDLNIEQKAAKRNLYVDSRDLKEEETNEDWDEDKLKAVAETKHGADDSKRANQTEIVCKYFIEAVENAKYGWFWECPNGKTCIYRHALPPGFVLKKDRKNMEEMKRLNEISLEELIEKERQALNSKELTKVTLQSFVMWKKRKLREKKEKEEADEKAKKEKAKMGKHGGLSGRDIFLFNPDLIHDDDDADDITYERDTEEVDPDEKVMEIDAAFFTFEGMELMDTIDENGDPTAGTGVADEVGKMTINADLFDADDIPDEDDES